MARQSSVRVRIGFLFAGALCAACGSDSGADVGSAGAASSGAGAHSAGAAGATVFGGAGAPAAGATNTTGGAGASNTGGGGGGASASGGAGGATPSAGATSGGSTNGGSTNGGAPSSAGAAGSSSNCPTVDPLKTNTAKQDAYDCAILEVSTKWGMPDPMIVKSQIQQESSFQILATSGDSPCGIMQGWTDAESKSFGLIQTTPACGEALTARLPNGHPNLTKDMSAALWANSVFNPTINLDEGVKTDVDSLKELKKKYPNCTAIQYNMMAAGAFNSGTGAITGCGGYNARAQMYVTAITSHYHQFAKAAGWPDPY